MTTNETIEWYLVHVDLGFIGMGSGTISRCTARRCCGCCCPCCCACDDGSCRCGCPSWRSLPAIVVVVIAINHTVHLYGTPWDFALVLIKFEFT